MSLYVDTSCLLKLLFREPERHLVFARILDESEIVVSDLARLEALVQINARVEGRRLTSGGGRSLWRALLATLASEPFIVTDCPTQIMSIAQLQVSANPARAHCRTLDRLHLAAMEGLGLRRLLTNDDQQAGAARALGFDVLMPR